MRVRRRESPGARIGPRQSAPRASRAKRDSPEPTQEEPSATPSRAAMNHGELIEVLRCRLEGALERLIPRGERVALLDFPPHMNVGDSAIWLAELDFLRRNRNRVVYVCDPWTYSPTEADRRMGEATILLSGGGNFGDLYVENQALRERVAA